MPKIEMRVMIIVSQLRFVEFGLWRLQLVAASRDCPVEHDVLAEDYDKSAYVYDF